MSKPRIEIRYIDGCDMDPEGMGWLSVTVNGDIMDSILCDFDTGNDARLHIWLERIVEAVYERGRKSGIEESRKRVSELIKWATADAGQAE